MSRRRSGKENTRRKKRQLQMADANVLGFVLTGSDSGNGKYYKYRYGKKYGYGYRYKYYRYGGYYKK